MTTTYPIELPDGAKFKQIDMRLARAVGITQSPYSKVMQVQKHQGAQWMAEIILPPQLGIRSGRAWQAWINSLCGQAGTFMMGDPLAKTPMGTATGALVDATTAARSTTLAGKGMSAGATLLWGDQFQVGLHLYQIGKREGITADGSGDATLEFEPPLREAAGEDNEVIMLAPKGIWRLAAGDLGVSIKPNQQFDITIPCMEDV